MEQQGYGSQPAPGYASTTHPELHGTNPNATPATHEKKGVVDKVKGLLGGHGQKTGVQHQPGVYGDATPTTGNAESTRVGCLDKIKAKAGVGHGLAPEQTRAHQAGDPSASPDFNGGTNINSSAAVHGGWPQPTNPHQSAGAYGGNPNQATAAGAYGVGNPNPGMAASGYSDPQPMNPTGVTNAHGGAVLGDHHGNVHEGPRHDDTKNEGFASKIMDKLHSPKGKPAHTSTTAPNPY